MRLNTNVSSLTALRAMSEHTKKIEETTGKISSGSRVRNAADDAASLAIGLKINSTRRSQLQAIRNSNDAISEFQVAEGSMNEMGNILTRLRELSTQGATGTLENSDRSLLNIEYMQLRSELERLSESTQFNGRHILKAGAVGDRNFQIGVNADAQSQMTIDESKVTVNEYQLKLVDSHMATQEDSRLNLQYIDEAINTLSGKRAFAGSVSSSLQSNITNLSVSSENNASTQSRMLDADMAFETSEKIRAEIKQGATASVLMQANNLGANALKLLK